MSMSMMMRMATMRAPVRAMTAILSPSAGEFR